MKIIHCADLHLDSPFAFLEDTAKKKTRRAELLTAFQNMADYAAKNGVSAVIIAGDLFDGSRVSATAVNAVIDTVKGKPAIDFYYLRGNHDSKDALKEAGAPANLHGFGADWTCYELGGKVKLYGAELSRENASSLFAGLVPDQNCFNIVTLHGQEAGAASKDGETINLGALRNKGIDYLALGHIHSFRFEALDGRGRCCYPGCLEQRGYDETGDHGFVVLDIDESTGKYSADLVSSSIRSCRLLDVDVSGAMTTQDALAKVEDALNAAAFPKTDLVKIQLVGQLDVESECDETFLEKRLEGRFFHVKVKSSTGIKIDYGAFRLEQTLKGEFVRTVQACEELSEEEKAAIVRMGIDALAGREIL